MVQSLVVQLVAVGGTVSGTTVSGTVSGVPICGAIINGGTSIITGDHSVRTQILLVKMVKYIGFYVYHRSY